MDYKEIINTASTVSQAMDTVEADIYTPLGCKSALDLLEHHLISYRKELETSLSRITEDWNAIAMNDLRMAEIRNILNCIEAFGTRAEQFDNFCTMASGKSDTPTFNYDLGREYYLATYDTLEYYSATINAIKSLSPRTASDSQYKGIARRLQHYVRTASDTDWENLITKGMPFRNIGKWEGTRVEATVLGTLFRIPAAALNKSIIFPTADGSTRKINYAQDKITCGIETYAIYPLIEDYITKE